MMQSSPVRMAAASDGEAGDSGEVVVDLDFGEAGLLEKEGDV